MNTGMPAAVLSVLVQARGVGRTNAELAKTQGVLSAAGGAAMRMGQQLAKFAKYGAFAAAGAIAVAVKKAIDFDKEMRNVNSIAHLSEKALGRVRDKVLELAGKTAQAPATLAAGLYDLVSSGFNARESLQILAKSARAATAGLTTTEISTKAVAAVLNAYHLKAKMAGDTSDVLFQIVNRGVITFEELAQNIGDVLPFGASLGVNLREIGASIATMTKAGITAPETMTRIKSVMVAMLKPSEALHKAIEQQGFDTSQAMLDALGFQGTLDALSKSTHGNKEAMAALFPNVRALGGALALTGANSKSAAEDLKGMQDAAGATGRALSQQKKSTSYLLRELRSEVEVLAIKFGEDLLPEINRVIKIITDPHLSAEEKFTRVFHILVTGAQAALTKAVELTEQYGPKIVATLASSIASAWWHLDIFGKILGAAALIRVLGGPGALTATGKAIGRQFGLGVSEGMATTVAATAGPALAAAEASAARSAAGAAAWSPAAPVLGSGAARQAAATATSRAMLQDAFGGFTLATVAAETGKKSAFSFLKGWSSRLRSGASTVIPAVRDMGGNLVRGFARWGLGGLVVGGITKELIHGNTGQQIGTALERAGVGAAIGSAIAPGIGTAIGAALGAGSTLFTEDAESVGDKIASNYLKGLQHKAPEIEKAVRRMELGQGPTASHVIGGQKASRMGVTVEVGDPQVVNNGSGLRGLRASLQENLKAAEAANAGAKAMAALKEKLDLVNAAIGRGVETIATYKNGFDTLRSGVVTRMKDISEVTQQNVGRINEVWAHNPEKWRQAMAESMRATISAIKSGMHEGVISTETGTARIKEITRNLRLVEGRDPFGIAEGFAASWKQAGKITNSQIDHMLGEMRRMPKGSREAAQNAMIQMAHAMENKGELVKGSASRLSSALLTKFGKTNKQLVGGVVRAGEGIAGVFSSLVNSVSGYLNTLGGNVGAILKAFGVSKGINFTVKVAKSAVGAVGSAVSGVGEFIQGKQSGGFIVPGSGSGDRPGFTGEIGAFVLNREATRAFGFNRGGHIPLALEPGERYFTRREVSAMGGTHTLEAMNNAVPRFQKGGTLGKPQMTGPAGPLRDLGQAAANQAYQAAQEYIKKHRPKPEVGAGGYTGPAEGPAGTSMYKGILMATWVRQALEYAAGHGASGQPTSGYRPPDQVVSGPVVAPQGHSEHQGTQYPHGAVDFGGPYDPPAKAVKDAVVAATRSFKYPLLAPIGFHDDGHASGTGHQLGGLIQALANGGGVNLHGPPLFQGEGPEWYAAALKHNQPWATHQAPWDTSLNAKQEREFEAWGRDVGGHNLQWWGFDPHRRRNDYDMRGFWLHGGRKSADNGHFADTWKTPYDTTFSAESKYATQGTPFVWSANGRWLYDRRTGQEIISGRYKSGGTVVTGKVSWFNGGATAGGSDTSQPGLALNLNPGTESGWNNATTRGWRDASLAGHPVYGQTTITGHTANLPITDMGPAASTGRAIDVTEGGVRKLGFNTSNFPTDALGKVVVEGGGGATAKGLTEGQKKMAEGKQRKANNERHLKALEQEVAQAHSPIAKQSKLWRLIKLWGRTGIFEKDEKQHILEAVQSAAAQTKPQSSVNILSHLSDYAKGHGEITGDDPTNFRDFEKAIERAQDRGREQRKKAVERQKEHVQRVHQRVGSKIEKRAAFPEWVERLKGLRHQADIGEEFASQLVALEPENIGDTYVERERGAYGTELSELLSWRNTTIRAQEFAGHEIEKFEAQIAAIEAQRIGVGAGQVAQAGKGKKQHGGWVEALAKGGSSGANAKHQRPAADTFAAYDKQKYKIPLLEEAIANAKTMRDETWAGELEEIQGLTGPSGLLESLPSEPVAGAFGGRIFEIQNAIRELALKVSDASGGAIELKELQAQLNTDWHKRFLVSEAQRNTIADFNASYPGGQYAGTFATGGHIGTGQWGIAGETGEPEIVHGPARVFSPSESEAMMGGGVPQVIINGDVVQAPGDTRDPVELLIGSRKLKAHIEKTARGARATGRPTPGGR